MLHALAFNTLLSSQETDAFTIGRLRPVVGPGVRGIPFRVTILADPPDSCQPDPFRAIHPDRDHPVSGATLQPYSNIRLLSNLTLPERERSMAKEWSEGFPGCW
ncbi:hypothetical protein GCM10018955_43790 [Planomonospora venezuelensis]